MAPFFVSELPQVTVSVALANADMGTFLKSTYTQWAQTRKAASYGFLQVLYTTAM